MSWLQLSIAASRPRAEQIASTLERAGALAVTLEDAGDEPQLEPAPGETPLWPRVRVSALFAADADGEALVDALARELGGDALVARIADQAWERVWLDTFRPTRFGRRLWVCPHGQAPDDPDARVVFLDPGLAFGTGHHATTALCLEWLDAAPIAGKTVLDYGCGSGILAIAALRLGAATAIAVDHDPQALEATRENALANALADRITIYRPEDLPPVRVDAAVANILAGPLIELAPLLTGVLRPGGGLAISGVLAHQVEALSRAYADRVLLAPPRVREDWALISGRRR